MQRSYKKFALIGTSCTGKTTLIKDLSLLLKKEYAKKDIAVVPEAARLYFGAFQVKNPFSYKHQRNVQLLARQLEIYTQEHFGDIVLTDRSVVDAIAYVWAMGDRKGAKRLIKLMEDWFESYDHIFLLDPAGISYKTDKVRKESAKTRDKFHKAFLTVLPHLSSSWKLISGSKNRRLQTMLKIIYRSS